MRQNVSLSCSLGLEDLLFVNSRKDLSKIHLKTVKSLPIVKLFQLWWVEKPFSLPITIQIWSQPEHPYERVSCKHFSNITNAIYLLAA